MKTSDEFFQPVRIDEQIENLSDQPLVSPEDAEMLAYLRSFYALEAAQERATLQRMWGRVVAGSPLLQPQDARKEASIHTYEPQTLASNSSARGPHKRRGHHLGLVAVLLCLAVLIAGATVAYNTLYGQSGRPTDQPTTAPTAARPTPTATPTQPLVVFKVTGVDMSVSPTSITGIACGNQVTITYTATFHIAAYSPGGTIRFMYTVNNGRGLSPASQTVAPGQTTATYQFQWSGALPVDHTYPAQGGVIVTSPNQLNVIPVGPSGRCG